HTSEPVPYLLFDRDEPGPGGEYSERGVAGATPVPAHELMARLLRCPPRCWPGPSPGSTVIGAAGRFFAHPRAMIPVSGVPCNPGSSSDLSRSDNTCTSSVYMGSRAVARRVEGEANEPGATHRSVGARRQG